MTDIQNETSKYYKATKEESLLYGDLIFQHCNEGIEFGHRMIYQMVYAMKNYNFDYLLRIDDDVFLCLTKFFQELPFPVEPLFHWGIVHNSKTAVRPDEGIILFSSHLITTFLRQDSGAMKCHPIAGPMVGIWVSDLNLTHTLHHDKRIKNVTPRKQIPLLRKEQNLCSKYMAIHGFYYDDMLLFWQHRGAYHNNTTGNLKDNSKLCISTSVFNWKKFIPSWRFEPKLCISDPTWDASRLLVNGHYGGRQNN